MKKKTWNRFVVGTLSVGMLFSSVPAGIMGTVSASGLMSERAKNERNSVMDEEPEENKAEVQFVEAEAQEVVKTGQYKLVETGSKAHGNKHIYFSQKGSAEYEFTGDAISVYTKTGSGAGIANIYLDDVLVATDDQYTAAEQFNRRAYTKVFEKTETHKIRIETSGEKNEAAKGTTLNVDCFKVFRLNSRNTKLSSLNYSINGGETIAVPKFSSDTDSYVVTLPAGTKGEILLSGETESETSTVKTEPVQLVDGTAKAELTVTAEEGNTKTYTVSFKVETPVKNMNLSKGFLAPKDGTWDHINDHKIYFGEFNNEGTMMPVLYRVLRQGDGMGQTVAEEDTLFLDCQDVLKEMPFDADDEPNEGQETGKQCEFGGSDPDIWLNGEFYEDSFSEVEKAAIASTNLEASDGEYGLNDMDAVWFLDFAAPERKVFMLSAMEANLLYPHDPDDDDNSVERAKKSAFEVEYGDRYWLRSSDWYEPDFAGWVAWNGSIGIQYVLNANEQGVSPSLNLDLSDVLLVSAPETDKTTGLSKAAEDTAIREWELTLLDPGKTVQVQEGKGVTVDGSTVTIPYTYKDTNADVAVNQISIMITNGDYTKDNAEVLYYGKLDTELAENGTGTFTLPGELPEGAKIYMMAECVNSGKGSDYVSEPVEITLSETEEETISTEVLKYALDLAKEADTTGVIKSVVDRFEILKQEAQEILDRATAGDETLTQEMVDQAWKDLIQVMQYLSFKQGEKADLNKVIDMAESLDLSKYLEEGQKEFADALTAAKKVAEDEDAMQDEVDSAWRLLLQEMSQLRLKPNKDALEALIVSAKTVSLADATETDAAMFRTALAEAESVYADEEATEEEVGIAVNNLQAAIDKVATSAENETTKVDVTDKAAKAKAQTTTTNNAGKTSAAKSAKTGDAANVAGAATAMMAAGAAVMVLSRRKTVH